MSGFRAGTTGDFGGTLETAVKEVRAKLAGRSPWLSVRQPALEAWARKRKKAADWQKFKPKRKSRARGDVR